MTHYGITTRDATMLVGVAEHTVRKWKSRGLLALADDGHICPITLVQWYEATHDKKRAARSATATRRPTFRTS